MTKRLVIAALVALAAAPAAVAALIPPERPSSPFPPAFAQRAAVRAAIARGEPLYCGGGAGNAVALTFDDGPGPYTAQIVHELRAADAHATFFLVGNRVQYWPSVPREEETVGSVGNHTWSHASLPGMKSWLVWLELLRTQYTVSQADGSMPKLFRVPYARHDARVDRIARSLGLLEVFWDVDARDDVPNPRVSTIVRTVERGLRPGAIVIMHDIHPWTAEALPQILRAITLRGLRAVSVPELLALDPPRRGQGCPYAPVGGGD